MHAAIENINRTKNVSIPECNYSNVGLTSFRTINSAAAV